MRRAFTILFSFLVLVLPFSKAALQAQIFEYQNYNHGYCPECQCAPCQCANGCNAPSQNPPPPPPNAPCNAPCQAPCTPPPAPCDIPQPCQSQDNTSECACGISIYAIGVAIAALAVAGVIIVSSGNGSAH